MAGIYIICVVFTCFNARFYHTPLAKISSVTEKETMSRKGTRDAEEYYYTQKITARILNGTHKGEEISISNEYTTSQVQNQKYHRGDTVLLSGSRENPGKSIRSVKRDGYLALLAGGLFFLLICITGKQGFYTIISLILNTVIFAFGFQAFMKGENILNICNVIAFLFSITTLICTGTYLKARCIYGDVSNYTGPNGLQAANYLTDSLKELGIEMFRFKTGTPARIAGNTIDYSKMEEQFGDERVVPFSFSTNPEDVQIEQKSCWLTYTNEKTHEIIRANLDRSPLYSGMIEGTGPRYCPSIEDKVVRFADKNRHQVFIEPEGLYTNEMYIGGMSSSLPEDVQEEMYHSVPGLEHAKIVKNAYAIEYDCINPRQLYPTLEFKKIKGLFSGGQFNGSSGYEEAAAQGLIAGINAALEVKGQEQLILDRSEAYIGVLIDDLVTKENHEPYRMMTSRAEYRLLLRQDNADLRLRKKGYQAGLISEEDYQKILTKEEQIKTEISRVEHTNIGANKEVQTLLESYNSTPLKSGTTLAELIRRPELSYEAIKPLDKERPELPWDVQEQVDINIKYDGYIRRQLKQVEQFKKLEAKKIPTDIDYEKVGSLRIEARQKLEAYRPISIGQASRISGVSPADISVLLVYLSSTK